MNILAKSQVNCSLLIVCSNINWNFSQNSQTFHWNNKSIVLSSFYWGYLTLQLVAGSLAKIYGAKRFLIGAMTINSVACMLIPTAAIKFGSYGVMACRVLQGVSQGFFFPSVYALLGRWAPVPERSRLGSVVTTGKYIRFLLNQNTKQEPHKKFSSTPLCVDEEFILEKYQFF